VKCRVQPNYMKTNVGVFE